MLFTLFPCLAVLYLFVIRDIWTINWERKWTTTEIVIWTINQDAPWPRQPETRLIYDLGVHRGADSQSREQMKNSRLCFFGQLISTRPDPDARCTLYNRQETLRRWQDFPWKLNIVKILQRTGIFGPKTLTIAIFGPFYRENFAAQFWARWRAFENASNQWSQTAV